jgi:hypothetical protein
MTRQMDDDDGDGQAIGPSIIWENQMKGRETNLPCSVLLLFSTIA